MVDSATDHNPYTAPVSANEVSSVNDSPRGFLGTTLGWVTMFLLNLPLPLMLGASVSSDSGEVGMAVCVLCLLAVGVVTCRRSPEVMRAISIGAAVTALSQFFPILHIVAGLFAFAAADTLGFGSEADELPLHAANSFVGGFIATLVTALIVLFVAAAIGALIQFARGKFRKPTSFQDVG